MNFAHSFSYAIQGIAAALKRERNLRAFTVAYLISLILAWILQLPGNEWPLIVFAGGMFLAVELVNTALEHLSDAFHDHSLKQDDHYHESVKATKDIAAGASLVCALIWVCVLILIFTPHVVPYLS